MVNVEADALAGPLLARRAREAGIVYSLAYGDQPALICELVDWARAAGFEVIAAGKGTKYLPRYHASTPETVWGHYGFTPEDGARGDFNAADVQLLPRRHQVAPSRWRRWPTPPACTPPGGLAFPPCGVDDLRARAAAEGRRRPAAPSRPGRGDLERSSATAARSSATCAGASTSSSRRHDYVAPLLRGVRPASPTPPASTPRCTSPST